MTDQELLKFATGFSKGVTSGNPISMCYAVTAPLQSLLSMFGVETRLVRGEVKTPAELWEHYWLEMPDGRILDPTASQFEELALPAVYLGALPPAYRKARDC